uniref:Uncharacterized protein n=1 Tax=Tetranychus urticae TaxID=32264 RepID=T1JQ35_TETUR
MSPATLNGQPESYNSSKVIGFKGLEALALVVIIGVLLMISALTSFTNFMIIYKLRLFPRMEMIAFSDDGHVIFNHEANLNREIFL